MRFSFRESFGSFLELALLFCSLLAMIDFHPLQLPRVTHFVFSVNRESLLEVQYLPGLGSQRE